ncbi:PIN domain-containing protein [Actinopolyspora erythraea]|uniref:PIN domain-containing protein n=1 Tax=Actinopolyspora erythraea TaxID=414996 RepID=A0A099D1U8_9ACTN|nr:type II toxin-antitoxin system VapC family toxin [Actinopolyspora erythraea]ASU77913.1 PIN domain-containing protein [Actinopolyspora erythraea]KGI79896.1 ribonuclease [Actinopolyspora erythraea]
MLYVDTSAVLKLVRRERETDELLSWLDARHGLPIVSSVLLEVEVSRALHRNAPESLDSVPAVLGRIATYEIDDLVRATAASYQDPNLRSLDAIHLATAAAIFQGRLSAFVAYDKRLLAAADALELPTACPGN